MDTVFSLSETLDQPGLVSFSESQATADTPAPPSVELESFPCGNLIPGKRHRGGDDYYPTETGPRGYVGIRRRKG